VNQTFSHPITARSDFQIIKLHLLVNLIVQTEFVPSAYGRIVGNFHLFFIISEGFILKFPFPFLFYRCLIRIKKRPSLLLGGRDSSVGTVTGYGLDGRGWIPARGKIFLFSTASELSLWPTQPRIKRVTRAVSPEIKRQWRVADHSTPSSAEVKTGGAIPPLLHISS
jgi:hypothetical protein